MDLFSRGISGASADGRFLDRRTKNKLAIKTVSESAAASRLVFTSSSSLPIEVRKAAANQGVKPGELKAAHWNGKTYNLLRVLRTNSINGHLKRLRS